MQIDIDLVVRIRIANLLVMEGLVVLVQYPTTKHMAIAQAQGPSV